jgi:hypothetical protein
MRWRKFAAAAAAAGVLARGGSLHQPSASTAVRVRADEDVLTDGPFVETEEQITLALATARSRSARSWRWTSPITAQPAFSALATS